MHCGKYSNEQINIYTLHTNMSKLFRIGDGKASTRGTTSSGQTSGGAVKKKCSSQSVPTAKRKFRSVGSAASNVRPAPSDSHITTPQGKASPSAVTKSQPAQGDDKETTSSQNAKVDSELDHKRREFLLFRKEFIQQQNAYIDRYAQLRDMEAQSGVDSANAGGEVRLLSVTDWPVHDLLLMSESAPSQQQTQIKGVLGPKILQQLTVQLAGIREEVLAMGTELMRRRLEILKFIRAIQRNEDRAFVYEGKNIEWQTKNAEFDEETTKLRELVLATVKDLEVKLTHSLDAAKIPWIDRDNMIKKIERLQKELANQKKSDPVKTEKTIDYKKLAEELQRERAARVRLKESLAAAEDRVATVRARCADLERQLSGTRSKWSQNPKQSQSSLRGSNNELVPRKSEKETKKREVTVEVLSRQRDTLQTRVAELEEQAKELMVEAEQRESEVTSHVESLVSKLEEEEKQRKLLETQAQETENRLKHLQEQYNKLQERSRLMVEAQHMKSLDYLPRKVQCSTEDFEILCDLQATKDALGRVKTELDQYRADKEDLVKSLAEIAQREPENGMAEKLFSKERTIIDLRRKLEELTENNNMMEQNLRGHENQISALQLEVSLLRNWNCYKSCNKEIPHGDLEKQVLELCLRVDRLTRERETLASEAAMRALMLERHERCAELFAQVTRARRDLAAQLDGTDAQLLNGAGKREVSSMMSKTYLSSANTWSALRAERARVLRLEGIVFAQTQQLDRESTVRIKLDRRRAQLERQLLRTWACSINVHEKQKSKADTLETQSYIETLKTQSYGDSNSLKTQCFSDPLKSDSYEM